MLNPNLGEDMDLYISLGYLCVSECKELDGYSNTALRFLIPDLYPLHHPHMNARGTDGTVNLIKLYKWMADQGLGEKKQTLLEPTMERNLWRVMIARFLKGHST